MLGQRKFQRTVESSSNLKVIWLVLGGDDSVAHEKVNQDEVAVWLKVAGRELVLDLRRLSIMKSSGICSSCLFNVPQMELLDLVIAGLQLHVFWDINVIDVLNFGLFFSSDSNSILSNRYPTCKSPCSPPALLSLA